MQEDSGFTPITSRTRFDITKLQRTQVRHRQTKQDVFESIMAKIHHRIEMVASRNDVQCVYQVPNYMAGMPLYNVFECCKHVIDSLKHDGFSVQYLHPLTLVIDWASATAPETANSGGLSTNTNTIAVTNVTESTLNSIASQNSTIFHPPAPSAATASATPSPSPSAPTSTSTSTSAPFVRRNISSRQPTYVPTGRLFQ